MPSFSYTARSISYAVPENAGVSLKMYNARGEVVSTLVNGFKSVGSYSVPTGKLVAGIYICELRVNGKAMSQKITAN